MRLLLLLAIPFLLAGCTDTGAPSDTLPTDPGPSEPSQPGNGFAPQTGHQEESNDHVSLVGDLYAEGCAEMFCIDAVATNEGSEPVYISNICVSPWSETMADEHGDVQKTEPYAVCLAWGVRAMEPGEQVEANFTWDGRLWDSDAEEYRDAPQGSYTWSIHFDHYGDDGGGDRDRLTIDFPVIIGPT